MSTDITDLNQMISRILSLSQAMLEHAKENVWSKVAETSIEREPLVQALAKYLQGNDELDQDLISGLENILEINQTLEALGQTELNRCATEARQVMQNRKGINVYTGV